MKQHGIREPLYVTALKHAGCEINADDRPQHIESMQLSAYREQMKKWFREAEYKKRKQAEESVLAVKNLYFSYVEGTQVLQHIHFDIHKGEMVSIVGKNGAGKSTLAGLLRILCPTKAVSCRGEELGQGRLRSAGRRLVL